MISSIKCSYLLSLERAVFRRPLSLSIMMLLYLLTTDHNRIDRLAKLSVGRSVVDDDDMVTHRPIYSLWFHCTHVLCVSVFRRYGSLLVLVVFHRYVYNINTVWIGIICLFFCTMPSSVRPVHFRSSMTSIHYVLLYSGFCLWQEPPLTHTHTPPNNVVILLFTVVDCCFSK